MAAKSTGKPSWARMESCLGVTAPVLAECILRNDRHHFIDGLNDDNVDLNEEMEEHQGQTLLHLAVREHRFVEDLLRSGKVDVDQVNSANKMSVVHIAAEKGQYDLLHLLLDFGKANAMAKMADGRTPLHLVAARSQAKWIKDDLEKRQMQMGLMRCANVLLNHPAVNVDGKDNFGATSLYLAIVQGSEEMTELLIDNGACVTVEVEDESIEEVLKERMPNLYDRKNLSKNRRDNDSIENKLFQVLYEEYAEPGKFNREFRRVSNNNEHHKIDCNLDNGSYTFLQYACNQGLTAVVQLLLEEGADANLTTQNCQTPPIILAAHQGYHAVLQCFMDVCQSKKVDFGAQNAKGETILHVILKEEGRAMRNYQERDYSKCLNMFLSASTPTYAKKSLQPAIDQAESKLGNTPLHIAVATSNEEAIRKLLRSGANIGVRNALEKTPIDGMDPSIMEDFLDECLDGENTPAEENFKLTFKYAFLGPSLRRKWKRESLREKLMGDGEVGHQEEEEENVHLPECEPLWHLSQSRKHRHLLSHPVVASFLCLKWRKTRPAFFINLAFYLLFVAVFTAYLLFNADPRSDSDLDENRGLRWASIVLLALLALREAFQAAVSFKRYILSLENIFELIAIICGALVLSERIESLDLTRRLSALALLLTWGELVALLGRQNHLITSI